MSRKVALPFLLVSVIWGSTWFFIKIGLAFFPPFLFGGIRLGLAVLFVGGYLALRRIPLPKAWTAWWPAMVYGFFEGLGFMFVFWGESYIPSSLASVITALNPLLVVVLSVPFLRERLDGKSVGSALLGLLGVLLATTNVHAPGFVGTTAERYLGIGFLALTALLYAQAAVLGKKYIRPQNPMVTAFIQIATSAAVLLLAAAIWEPVPTPLRLNLVAWGAVLYLAVVGSGLAFGLYFYCLEHMRAAELALLTVISPIVAIAMGAAFLRESAGWHVLLGALAVVLSIVWMNRPGSPSGTTGHAAADLSVPEARSCP